MSNYVLKTNADVLVPVKQNSGLIILKVGVGVVVLITILGSFIFQENLFSELSWSARILLIALVAGVMFKGGGKEYAPSPMELQFFEDYIVLYFPKQYYSKRVTSMEFFKLNYSDITKCVYKVASQRVHIYGKGTSTWYNYRADGTLPQIPTKTKNFTDGLVFFGTRFATDVDFKKEIEEHSPVKVIIENS